MKNEKNCIFEIFFYLNYRFYVYDCGNHYEWKIIHPNGTETIEVYSNKEMLVAWMNCKTDVMIHELAYESPFSYQELYRDEDNQKLLDFMDSLVEPIFYFGDARIKERKEIDENTYIVVIEALRFRNYEIEYHSVAKITHVKNKNEVQTTVSYVHEHANKCSYLKEYFRINVPFN